MRTATTMASRTEDYVRNLMRPVLRRQFQPIALRIIAEGGGSAEISQIHQAIQARHSDIKWDARYPIKVLADNGILKVEGTTVSLVEQLDPDQIASLLSPSTNVPSVRVDFASRMHRGARIQPNGALRK
jgi:hypothetical protein